MPIYDYDDVSVDSPLVVIDWDGGGLPATVPVIDYLFLHASSTNTLYHAEGTTGESTPVTVIHNLVDQDNQLIVDELGNQLAFGVGESAILFHAKETDTLFHAEA